MRRSSVPRSGRSGRSSSARSELEERHTRYGEPIAYFEHENGKPYLATPDPEADDLPPELR